LYVTSPITYPEIAEGVEMINISIFIDLYASVVKWLPYPYACNALLMQAYTTICAGVT
jgi:hypothetical protein